MAYTQPIREPIAIIGSGCRFPGDATSPSKLWELLHSPRDVSKRVPASRFNPDAFYHPNGEHHGASNVAKSYFIEEDPRFFDSVFFNITPREAEAIDPQQRVLLETVYEAMDSAGLTMNELKGTKTSAYVGLMTADFNDATVRDPETFSQYMATGTSRALISNRLSYFFDWKGPSMTVDTACSSSLTAIHLAVQSLRAGESKVACAAGANLLMGPDLFIGATSLHMISPSGKSQMWDQSADGYARGEGVAAVFLKTLSQALKDGDRIEALIRETGVNSDGRTKGITLPSPEAQATLIRDTYQNAGLDIERLEDRPQYFEAHGTGTQAGDPREASAINQSFFSKTHDVDSRPKLFVGSIKTIIGHTEGCAGVAGVLKAVLAMKNKTIPPNQHLRSLNPSVEVSYQKLHVPTEPTPWPSVSAGHPLRASVNSFGFGGTNTHAILETYVPDIHGSGAWGLDRSLEAPVTPGISIRGFSPIPIVLSANSEATLAFVLEQYAEYLKTTDFSIHRLATTLSSRRTVHPVRTFFSGTSKKDVLDSVDKELSRLRENPGAETGVRSKFLPSSEDRKTPRILGVFTGQGAQWATMARSLIIHSPAFRETIDSLEKTLAGLSDPPEWSLKEELMASPLQSRLGEAALSQPLCTAVQVGLVNLLSLAGITFHTVIGHSSGEIGAAYAAGKLSAVDAIIVAYYRGVHAKLAGGSSGQKGSMIAVGFGLDEAISFCSSEPMQGRLSVAASNSPGSVTLSGDEDAVLKAKAFLDEEGLFSRVLKVDTAYHSHHMKPCADPYVASLTNNGIRAACGNDTTWVSSVYHDNRVMTSEMDSELAGLYWRDNMENTVLFSQAVESALDKADKGFDLALEIGPHPALKGPALQTIKSVMGTEIPYAGLLDRKKDDVVALSDALGFLWTMLGPEHVDLVTYSTAFGLNIRAEDTIPLGDLPTYPWEHKAIHWRESRLNKQLRSRPDGPHSLLGKRCLDDTDYEPRWRNILKLEEMPWLRDHRIQGQIVVPGAMYCAMALEAAKILGRDRNVQSIELLNVEIQRPISLDENSEGTETILSVASDLDSKSVKNIISATFSLSAGSLEDGHMRAVCSGCIRILVGDVGDAESLFPLRPKETPAELTSVDPERFYEALAEVGLNYTGPFRGVEYAERCMDLASAIVKIDDNLAEATPVHPSWLDVSIQTLFAALAAPHDGFMWSAFVPSKIGRMKFSPSAGGELSVIVDSWLTNFQPPSMGSLQTITGDINIYNRTTGQLEICVDDITLNSLLPAAERDDRQFYLKTEWKQDSLSGAVFGADSANSVDDEVAGFCETAIRYYLSNAKTGSFLDTLVQKTPGLSELIDRASRPDAGVINHREFLRQLDTFEEYIDVRIIRAVGERLLGGFSAVVSGRRPVESSMASMLSTWQNDGLGMMSIRRQIVRAAKQLAHKFPHMNIVQVGAGVPEFVKSICDSLGTAFASYSVLGRNNAIEDLSSELEYEDPRVILKGFGAGDDGGAGGLSENTADLVIVLQTVGDDHVSLEDVRRTLKPGGFLLMMTATGDYLRHEFYSLLAVESSTDSEAPTTTRPSLLGLHKSLVDTGFSGIDSVAFDSGTSSHMFSVVFSQAVDARVNLLRAPLAYPTLPSEKEGKILIVGGSSLQVAKSIELIQSILSSRWDGDILRVEQVRDVLHSDLDDVEIVVSLAELDQPILENLDSSTFEGLKKLLKASSVTFWVTQGSRGESPHQAGTVGLGRSFMSENPDKTLQFLDVNRLDGNESLLVESLLRLVFGAALRKEISGNTLLWTIEPELALSDGKLLIPRLLPDTKRNDRINSIRRDISRQTDVSRNAVSLQSATSRTGQVIYRGEFASPLALLAGPDDVTIKVQYSSVDTVLPNFHGQHLYLCIGKSLDGETTLALSTSNASIITTRREWTTPYTDREQSSRPLHSVFVQMIAAIQAQVIGAAMPQGYTSLLLDPANPLVGAVEAAARTMAKRFRVLKTQCASSDLGPGTAISIMPGDSKRELRSRLPSNSRLLIRMGCQEDDEILNSVQRAIRHRVPVMTFEELSSLNISAQEALTPAMAAAHSGGTPLEAAASVVKASDLVAEGSRLPRVLAVDWENSEPLSAIQKPIDPTNLFSPEKTYILVGLTGDTGCSVCRWMIASGARHIVVTSRNPKTNVLWEEELKRLGANVAIKKADVTKAQDLRALRARITASMPPIGGIINGAMVLADGMFADMSFESFHKVLEPKMTGSKNLDAVFADLDLDFFLMLSSLSAIIGMPSQSNYAAANSFMVGLAEQRRQRNAAASVVDIGMILGIGVIQRSDGEDGSGVMQTSLRRQHYMPLSERDLHHLLAEAIVAGKADGSPEITTGLEPWYTDSAQRPVWYNNPRFSHLVRGNKQDHAEVGGETGVQKALKLRLAAAASVGEGLEILIDAFSKYLGSLLKLPVESVNRSSPIIDLGIDSLVAVEIRGWIFTETGHDVPVLKILGGSSIEGVCEEIATSLSFNEDTKEELVEQPNNVPVPKSRNWEDLGRVPKAKDETGSSTPLSGQSTRYESVGERTPSALSSYLEDGDELPPPKPIRQEALSLGQSRLYFSSQYLEDKTAFNCTTSYTFSGNLDVERLRESLSIVTERHESFRTMFFIDEETVQACQGILEEPRFKFRVFSSADKTEDVKKEFERTDAYQFNVSRGETFIASLLTHDAQSHTIIFGYHHLIMDGVSWQIFLQDLAAFYNNPSRQRSAKGLLTQYTQFALKQKNAIAQGAYEERLKFFREEFSQPPEPLPLFPFAKVNARKSLTSYKIRDVVTHVDAKVVTALKEASKASRTTAFHFWLSTFQVLLNRFLGIEDVCIGIVDANRSDQAFSNTIGFLLEIMPVLFHVGNKQMFKDVLQATRGKAYGALSRTGVPIEEITKACGIPASSTHPPLFQVVFNYRMGATRTSQMNGVDMKFHDYADAKTPFDVAVSVDEMDDGTAMLTLSVQDYLYDKEGSDLLVNAYKHLLETFSKDVSRTVSDVPLFSEASRQLAVNLGTGPSIDLAPAPASTLSKIFDHWVEKSPSAMAVKDIAGNSKTYAQLSSRAGAIGAALQKAGAKPEARIGVLLEPNVDSIAAILGILRIGCVYVPLDVRSPNERLADIILESRADLILFDADTRARANSVASKKKKINMSSIPQESGRKVWDFSTADGPAMILFTSGTTGKPKGIPLTNANIRSPILGVMKRLGLKREVMLQQSGQGFDAAVQQVFTAFANGGTVIMGDNRGDPAELAALMAREKVTCTLFIVSEMHSMIQYGLQNLRKCKDWRLTMLGGEVVTKSLLDKFALLDLPDLRLVNAFGPTEASIISSLHEVSAMSEGLKVPIGKPLANYGTYIVDDENRPVPIGWPGEMAISGPGISEGYLNRPDLTNIKFRPNKFMSRETRGVPGWDRLYLTGDKGRMLEDGSIVILGRVDGDSQVKLRGMRVNLDDVAEALIKASAGNIADAVALVRGDDPATQILVSYAVFADKSEIADQAAYLKKLCQETELPPYMRPTLAVALKAMPVTERGKLDNKKLQAMPLPSMSHTDDEEDDDLTEQEKRMREVWKRVLGDIAASITIRRQSDFFSVGGNSLLLLKLRVEIRQEFDVELSLAELFQASTLDLLTTRVTGTSGEADRIDWEAETTPDVTGLQVAVGDQVSECRQHKNGEGINVLLTGATGFLGSAILDELVGRAGVAQVHCAAIRPDSQGRPRPLASSSSKVVRHTGDLSLPNLGMTAAEASALFERVDVVIHNGAEVSHMKNFRSLRASNVSSTAEIARLALARNIPVHYISTGGVAGLSGLTSQPETSLSKFPPPSDGARGYVASKWASEVMLEKISSQFGLPVWIHRPSNITGENVPTLDIVHSVLRHSRSMRKVPDFTGSTGAFDFIHLDTIARQISDDALSSVDPSKTARDEGKVTFVHQSGEEVVPFDELRGFLGHSAEHSIEIVSMSDWVTQAKKEEGLDEIVSSFLLASDGVVHMPLLERS